MATHKSAEKRHRQSLKRRDRNRETKATVRAAIKKARTAISQKDSSAKELVVAAERLLAKAATKGVYHKASASRKVSKLNAALNS